MAILDKKIKRRNNFMEENEEERIANEFEEEVEETEEIEEITEEKEEEE